MNVSITFIPGSRKTPATSPYAANAQVGGDLWSVVLKFPEPLTEGVPALGTLAFIVYDAPWEKLIPGFNIAITEGPVRLVAHAQVLR